MNKINPLYLLGFFILVFLLVVYKTEVMQKKIVLNAQNNVQIEADAKEIYLLKGRWKNQKQMIIRLKKILEHKAFASKVTKKQRKRNIYQIELKNLDYRTLDSFVNKILNEAIIIKKMTIQRNSENSASVSLECSL